MRLGARRDEGAAARVHEAADRAAARAPGVPARDASSPAWASGTGLPDSWWFRPDGLKMTRENWEQGGAPCIGVFLNGEELRDAHAAGRAARRRLVPDPLQRAPRAVRVRAAAAPLRPRVGGRALDRRARSAEPARVLARDAVTARVAVAAPAAAGIGRRMVRATYRLQLGSALTLRRRARARPVPARPRRQPPLPLAGAPGAARLDARLRRDRPAQGRRPARRRRARCGRSARRRATRAWARCSTSSRTTWRPIRENHVLARPGAARALLRRRPRDRPPPALLRHRRARPACASRSPRCSRRCTATCSTSSRRGSSTACASTTPTGSPIPAATSSGSPTGASTAIWVEKILEPGERLRDWPVEGTTGYEFLERRAGAVRRPGRRGGAHRARRPGRRSTGWADAAKLEQAMTTFQPEVERLRRLLDVPDLERGARVAAGLPHLRRAVERPRRGRRPRGGRRRCRTTCAACCCWRSAATTSSSRASSRRPAR